MVWNLSSFEKDLQTSIALTALTVLKSKMLHPMSGHSKQWRISRCRLRSQSAADRQVLRVPTVFCLKWRFRMAPAHTSGCMESTTQVDPNGINHQWTSMVSMWLNKSWEAHGHSKSIPSPNGGKCGVNRTGCVSKVRNWLMPSENNLS